MKKIAIFIVIVGMALSYSCNKNDKVQTQISGTLMTNGTNDPVHLSTELSNPSVILFRNGFNSGGVVAGETVAEEVARTTVDDNAHYSFDLELYENDEYFIGFEGMDESQYFPVQKWYPDFYKDYPVIPGTSNTVNPKAWAISWIRPRFINTNINTNNNDVFYYTEGPGPISTDLLLTDVGNIQHFFPLKGSIDTLAPWIHKSWSGQTGHFGYKHEVEAKLTRNGLTIDTIIPYFVPPFDTTIVEIRY
jgi:hypothetical protein